MDLSELSDRLEIEDLLVLYTHAIDTKDWDLLDQVFTPDAEIDYLEVGGLKGAFPEIKAWLAKTLDIYPSYQHMLGKSVVKLDGDKAECRTIVHNPMVLPVDDKGSYDPKGQPKPAFFVGCWYEDTCVRTDKGWRISKKYERASYFQGDMPPGTPLPQ